MTSQFSRIFLWHVVRHLRRHPLLALLNIGSVGLGVAVYLAIQIANHSANRAFAATVDVVAGKAELQITGPVAGVPETLLPAIARESGIAAATPLVRGIVTLPDMPGEYLQVLGIDIFTNNSFRTFELTDFRTGAFDVQRWLGDGDSIAVAEDFARAHHLQTGDVLRAQVNGADHPLRVGYVMRPAGAAVLDSHFAAMDIGWAQELFARRGFLTSIQLQFTRMVDRAAVAAKLRALLPPDATVATPARRGEQVEKMLGGFQLNLTAMSLVSLLVGMFLIYNTVSASVVRRRNEIGILRSLGTTRNEVRGLFLGEAIVLGVFGVIAGCAGGLLLARLLVGTVAQTISSLYVLISVRDVAVTPWMFASAAVLGLLAVIVAAWLPAAAAARMDPVRALRAGSIIEQSAALSPLWFWLGLSCVAIAGAFSFLALRTGPPWLGFGAAFFVLVGFSLVVPEVTTRFSHVASALLRRAAGPIEANLAAANLSRSLVRNSVTIAALAASVAMAIGVSVMVFSFRRTVESWIEQTLIADLFIAPASNQVVGPSSFIPPEAISYLETQPAVAAVDTFREVDLPMDRETVAVAVVRGGERRHLQFLRGDNAAIMGRFYQEESVLISESFARRHGMHDGDALEMTTPIGPRRFPVLGTFYDYTRDQGIVFMSAQTFAALWKDDRVNSLAVYLKQQASAEPLVREFRARFSQAGEFMMLSNRDLRVRIFEIFDQTFAVTYVLRTIAVLVAIVGICLTLTTLIAERSRELAIFRALGGSAAQLRKTLLWEASMIGFLAAMVGVASGLCLSFVLTGVINRAFFGWTIQLAFPWGSLAWTPVWIIAVALVAGWFPAWRAGRFVLTEALRSE
ncbi:MAG: FtsX-like permease family protein [Verrucomicrobiota bacterium]|nr:FtsX-like permease family protein [Verrucomicrobiota bacterium]